MVFAETSEKWQKFKWRSEELFSLSVLLFSMNVSKRRGALRLQGNEKELTTKQSYSEKTMNASESERKRVNFSIIE